MEIPGSGIVNHYIAAQGGLLELQRSCPVATRARFPLNGVAANYRELLSFMLSDLYP